MPVSPDEPLGDRSDHPSVPPTAAAKPGPAVSGVEEYMPSPATADDATWDEYHWYIEHAALLVTTVKWALLGAAAGVCVGLGTRLFLWALHYASLGAAHLDVGFARHYFLLPFALPACVWLIRHFAPTAKGHGTEAVIAAIHEHSGRIDWRVAPVKLGATVLTLAFGGSVGKEGPCAQIGASITSLFADLLRLDDADRRRLVICGIGAGFASVFGTPVSGALFGVEVLYLGRIEYPVLFPCLIAGIVGHLVCGVAPPATGVGESLGGISQPLMICLAVGFGAGFGLVALAMVECMRLMKALLAQFRSHRYIVAFAAGVVLALMYLVLGDSCAGLGTDTIHAALGGTAKVALLAFAVKIVATSLTLESGGSGGIVTPLFFIGATAGSAAATLFHLPAGTFAAFGFVAVLAAAANTPLAAAVMGMELLPTSVGVYAALCACTAYLIVGHRSVYSSQRLGMVKSPALELALGRPIGEVSAEELKLRTDSLTHRLLTIPKRRSRRASRDK